MSGVNISDALFYPYGATVSAGGNILFGTNTPQGSLGVTDGPVTGAVLSISPTGGGTYSAPATLVAGIDGTVQSLNLLNTVGSGQDLIVDSGFGSGRAITVYNSGNTQIGQLQFTYSTTDWWHPTGVNALRCDA